VGPPAAKELPKPAEPDKLLQPAKAAEPAAKQ
jgi:hypothetical protein